MKINYLFLLAVFLLTGHGSFSQNNPENAGRMDKGQFVLTINLQWNEQQKKILAENFDLDSLLVQAVFDKNLQFINDNTSWTAKLVKTNKVELRKDLSETIPDLSDKDEILQNLDKIILSALNNNTNIFAHDIDEEKYGINDLKLPTAFQYTDSIACFYLPSYQTAGKVHLAGSFNQWSTMQQPMEKTDSGWVACINLTPGKHLYKYIVDGKWITDPNNPNKEKDQNRMTNSVIFAYNHVFTLKNFEDQKRAFVAGSFNNWQSRELRMNKTQNGWKLPMFLKEGTYTYKYIIDGQWITDPENPVKRNDGQGNVNSVIAVGDSIVFELGNYKEAERVVLSGSFNNWNPNELVMQPTRNGWQLPFVIGAGNHEYKFIVDGTWMTDPHNPFTNGTGEFTNSFLAYKPNYIFQLEGFTYAKSVIVTGSFNGWSTTDYRLIRNGEEWIFPIFLKKGRHTYKYIIDGEWIMDPGNDLWEENEFGTGNSVLWIE
ncbi:MAG: glycogen-binding domain-containing protein [Bacteroidota bacterium]